MISDKPRQIEDTAQVREIVRSPDFKSYPMEQMYQKLEDATSIDFSATRTLVSNLPIYMDGEAHKQTRKLMAQRLAAARSAQEQAARDALGNLHALYFTRSCQFDLFSDFAHPLWRAISGSILDLGPDVMALVDQIPLLFAPTLSIRKRMALDEQIKQVLDAGDDGILLDLALATLGVRPFTGSLALSLYDLIGANPGVRYSELPFEQDYNASSLTFIDRIAQRDVRIAGLDFAGDEHVRCITNSDTYTGQENAANLYGYGAHVCLGRPLAQYVIRQLPQIAANYPVSVECIEFEWQKKSFPFVMPARAVIGVTI